MQGNLLSFLPIVSITFTLALVSVTIFVPKVKEFARRIGALQEGGEAHGKGKRIHKGKLPNIGGIAIFASFLLALLVGSMVSPVLIDAYRAELLAIVLGATLMTLVGFFDDLWEVPISIRLATQLVAAGILVVNGVKIGFITDYFGQGEYVFFGESLSVALTLLWVVGFTNAFNFIDGLDGLSSGIAAISSFALLTVAIQFADLGVTILLLAALAGASLGFLRYNFNPATIIMGDSGAYMLGYVLAAISVLGALKVTATVTVVVPVLILGLPLLNITQVTLRRLGRRTNPTFAYNDHIHDLIRERSGSKRLTVIILWLATLILATLGMMLSQTPPKFVTLTVIGIVVLMALVSYLRLWEVAKENQQLT